MKMSHFRILPFLLGSVLSASAQVPDGTSLTRIGQDPPLFSVKTLDDANFDLAGCKGRVVLLNFFAIGCSACKEELPDLQKNVWERFHDAGLVLLAIGREHSSEELEKFRVKGGFTFDMASDPKRDVFKLYATQNIPRNVLIGKDGKIAYQSLGYQPEAFKELVDHVFTALRQ